MRLLLALCLCVGAVCAQCYWPGGDLAVGFANCQDAYTSLCCPYGWTCLSNNLCVLRDPSLARAGMNVGATIRGTCTNPRWNDTVCGDFCLNEPVQENQGDVIPCGNDMYCCAPEYESGLCSCRSGQGTFEAPAGKPIAIVYQRPRGSPVFVLTAVPSTTPPVSITQQPATTTTGLTSSPTTTASTSILPIPTAHVQHEPFTDSSTFKIVIGVVVGIVGLVIILALVWWFWGRPRGKGIGARGGIPTPPEYLTAAHQVPPDGGSPGNVYAFDVHRTASPDMSQPWASSGPTAVATHSTMDNGYAERDIPRQGLADHMASSPYSQWPSPTHASSPHPLESGYQDPVHPYGLGHDPDPTAMPPYPSPAGSAFPHPHPAATYAGNQGTPSDAAPGYSPANVDSMAPRAAAGAHRGPSRRGSNRVLGQDVRQHSFRPPSLGTLSTE